jgi:proteasome activator subunit 4
MSCFAQCLVPNEDIPQIVDTVQSISGSQSWHARYSILPYIQVFVYNNIFAVHQQQHCVATLKEVIIRMLRDEQPEVSNMACLTLSGLLQCKVIALNDELLQHAYSLCKTKLSKKRKRTDDNNQTGSVEVPFNEKTFQTKLLKKHAGVLLLSACVLSHPYTVPEWLPGVVMRLANVLHDPQPIHDTVKRTLSEFRRTHHDNWHEDKLKSDNEELAILTDLLVSPSYYA